MTSPNIKLTYNNENGAPKCIELNRGEILFVVGGNGTGKSGLLAHWTREHMPIADRINAARASNIDNDSPVYSPRDRVSVTQTFRNEAASPEYWKHTSAGYRNDIIFSRLISAENLSALQYCEIVESTVDKSTIPARADSPLKILNRLLAESNLPISIGIGANDTIKAQKNKGDAYSSTRLSDGEKNAMLLMGEILTAPAGRLFLIDEPERHLHRSIITPMISSLLRQKSDCTFVVATHDIGLAVNSANAKILIVRSCKWNSSGNIVGWNADQVDPTDELDDDLKQTILGAKPKLMFVEGEANSLDKSLYEIIYPEVTVVSKGSCREVMLAVEGINSEVAQVYTWSSAVGLIDNDDRTITETENLAKKSVFTLPYYSVESLYYSREIIRRIAAKQAATTGGDSTQMTSNAIASLITCCKGKRDHLCARRVERNIRENVSFPTWGEILSNKEIAITQTAEQAFTAEKKIFDDMVAAEDVEGLIGRYPFRESGAKRAVTDELGLKTKAFESAVRTLYKDDAELRSQLKKTLAKLTVAVEGVQAPTEPVDDAKSKAAPVDA